MPEENTENTSSSTEQTGGETPANWGAFLEAQPENIKALYEQEITGLKNTIKATREERDQFSRELRDAAAKAEKGSEAEQRLSELANKAELAERRAAFVEEGAKPEIGCTNLKAAWQLAQADGLFDRKGSPDWAGLKASYPELFRKPAAAGNAGSGTTNNQPKAATMNDFIRAAAGRR